VSDRASRSERRAAARRLLRELTKAASPARPHPHCMVDGCDRPAPTVRIGAVAISLCAVHQQAYDEAWSTAITGNGSGRRTARRVGDRVS